MIPEDEPLMQHYYVEVVIAEPALRPAPASLPPIDAAAVRSFNQCIRDAAEHRPEYANVFAGFSFEKALHHCAKDETLLTETAKLLLRVFLAHDKPIQLRAMTRALERTEVGHPLDRYRVYVRAASSSEALLDPAFRQHCLEAALRLAEAMHEEEPENWQPLAKAHLLTADAHNYAKRPGRATEALDEALSLCGGHVGEPRHAYLATLGLCDLGRLLLDEGDLDEAQGALTDCASILGELLENGSESWVAERMCHVLTSQAELLQQQKDRDGAREKLAGAVDLSAQGSMMLEADCRSRLAKLLVDTGRQTEAADVLFELSGTYLLLGAAFANAAEVLDLAKVEAEDEGWTHGTHPEGEEQLTLHQRRLRDAERLLNLSPELGARRVRGLERSLCRGSSEDPERDPAQRRRLLGAWRALGLIRQVAVNACCYRSELDADWGQRFPAEPVSFGVCMFATHPRGRGDEYLLAHQVIVEVTAPPERQVDPIPELVASLVDAVARLRDRFDELPKKTGSRQARRLVRWSFAFKSLSPEEALQLQQFHHDAHLSDYQVGVPLHPYETPSPIPGFDLAMEEEALRRQEQGARKRYGLTVCETGTAAAGDRLHTRVAQLFELVMRSLTDGDPPFSLCQAPTSQRAYLSWRLGDRDDLSPCGRFYFPANRGTQACSTHSNVVSKLRNDTDGQLWDEAQRLAFQEFKNSPKSGHVLSEWEKARTTHPDCPADALACFRAMVKGPR